MKRANPQTPAGGRSHKPSVGSPPIAAGSPHTGFRAVYPAVATSVREVRHGLDQYAQRLGVSVEQRDAITLAASEAATNVVVHAYAGQEVPGELEVNAAVAGEELWVLVTDTGLGLRPRLASPGLGLGLAIIAQLADGVDLVRPAAGGVELRMRFALATNATM